MKILVVGNYYYPEHIGGVEVVSYNLVKYYRIFGSFVRWMAANVPPEFRNVVDGDIPIKSWNITEERLGFPHPIPYLSFLPKVWKGVLWCDVVHLQDCLYPINILAFFAAKLTGKPVLMTQYAKLIPYKQLYKRFLQLIGYRSIGWVMFNFSDRIAFITETVRVSMAYLTPNIDQEVIPLGVDVEHYAPVSSEKRMILREKICGTTHKPIILFVGRLVERKGGQLLRPLVEKYEDWTWVFIGRPDDFNPSEWKRANLKHYQDVSEDELRDMFICADVLVHPSVGEGITLTVSNSLACGTPVLITEEALYGVQENEREIFFAVKPETLDIEKTLVQVMANPARLEQLRSSCREFAVNRLSWERMCYRYYELLKEITI